uniref:Uncharacterized protein n=1 Tax=Oryza glumipatula TaxID=40148 RepID=A0A0E0BC12_9ORYZ
MVVGVVSSQSLTITTPPPPPREMLPAGWCLDSGDCEKQHPQSSRTGSLCSLSWPCMTPTILAALSAACVKPAGKALPEKKLSRLSFSHSLAIMPRMCSSASLAASPGFSLSSLLSWKSARASSSIAVHLVGKVCR